MHRLRPVVTETIRDGGFWYVVDRRRRVVEHIDAETDPDNPVVTARMLGAWEPDSLPSSPAGVGYAVWEVFRDGAWYFLVRSPEPLDLPESPGITPRQARRALKMTAWPRARIKGR